MCLKNQSVFLSQQLHKCVRWGSILNKRSLVAAVGVWAVGDAELRAEVSDRGAEIRAAAAGRDAQPPPAHLHRPHRQREEPRERRARAGPAWRAVRLSKHTASTGRRRRCRTFTVRINSLGFLVKITNILSVSISAWTKKGGDLCGQQTNLPEIIQKSWKPFERRS